MKDTGIFVPARLSSHRLPNKQILPIGNTNMFEICCNKLNSISKHGINTYVLICENELINIASKYPNIGIVYREEDTTKKEGPLNYIFKDVLSVSQNTHLMFLNPCLVFLSESTILDAITKFNSSRYEYATSVKKFQNWIMDNNMNLLCDIDYKRLTTKEIVPMYQFANAFHIFNRKNFISDGMELKDGFMGIEVKSEKECIDIDTEEDYLYAKWRYEKEYASKTTTE